VNLTTTPGTLGLSQTGFGALQTATATSANALVVSQNGFVGIGTKYPVSSLHVIGNVTISGSLTYNNVINTVTANTITANTALGVTGNSALANVAFTGTLVPNTASSIIQWQGGNPSTMIETYYGAIDRYGLGQAGGGTLRLYTSASYGPASICLGKYSTGGPTTTDYIVCNSSGIYNQAQVTMTANTIVFSGGANTQPIADRSGTFSNYLNAATLNFAAFSGMILVNNANTGAVSMFIMGGNAVTTVANSSLNPQTGAFAGNSSILGYTWTNNSGNTISASFTAIRTNTTN
jgi:hypothetical protein